LSGKVGREAKRKERKSGKLHQGAGGSFHPREVDDFKLLAGSFLFRGFLEAQYPEIPSASAEACGCKRNGALRPACAHAVDEKHRAAGA
jgi:hypothetical protein